MKSAPLCGIFVIALLKNVLSLGYYTLTTPETTTERSSKVCKQTVSDQYGLFHSPNYPDKYPRYSRCQYTIHQYSPDACDVKLTIHTFEVTRMTFTNCSEDFLEIQDKDKKYRICGDLPRGTKKFVSFPPNSDKLVFNFRSTFHQKKGFEIRVKQLPFSCRRATTTTQATTRAALPCSQTINGRQGVFKFPDNENPSMPESAGCHQEHLLLPDGQKLCGNLGGNRKFIQFPSTMDEIVITSTGPNNSLNIQVTQLPGPCDVTPASNLTSDDTYHQCDQTFQGPIGTLTTPGYPNSFGPNYRCVYKIYRPDVSVCSLELDFQEFDLGHHNPASCDHGAYLELPGKTDYVMMKREKIISEYGFVAVTVHVSEFQDPVTFEFVSDSLTSGKGFRIKLQHLPNTCPGFGIIGHIPKSLPRCFQEVSYYNGYFSPSPLVSTCELLVRRADPTVCKVLLQVTARSFLSVPCSHNYVELPDGLRMCISVLERRFAVFEEGYSFMVLNYVNWHNPEFNLLVEQIPNSCRTRRSDVDSSMSQRWSWKILPR
ncbi:cubilin [Caerostris extrusa]|uniref:Cubilin n=1 Tax=Caerostris extrusa TaxID=172846 RepID=A0AAV4NLD2_CAEEX|nr:cubilin [Caerostris extrusa]